MRLRITKEFRAVINSVRGAIILSFFVMSVCGSVKAQSAFRNGSAYAYDGGQSYGGTSNSGALPQQATFTYPSGANLVGSATAYANLGPSASAAASGSAVGDAGGEYYFQISGPSNANVPIIFGGGTSATLVIAQGEPPTLEHNAYAEVRVSSNAYGGTILLDEISCQGYGCPVNTNSGNFLRVLSIPTGTSILVSAGAEVNPIGSSTDTYGFASASAFIQIDPAFAAANPGYSISAGVQGINPLELAKQMGSQPCACSGSLAPLAVGEPITITNGNVYDPLLDYQTTKSNKLSFSRSYNSLASLPTFAASLGPNWRSIYDRYLNLISSSAVLAERADGQGLFFSSNGSYWTTDSDIDVKLTQYGSTWTLTDHDDTIETYTVSTSNPSEALLTSIQARNGYTQTLQYNASNQLISVTDSYGRSLTFTYNGSLLQTVTTPDGLVLTYGFNANGTLASVAFSTTPATSQTYLYENSALPFALTGIIDENGNRYATWTYDSSGRGLTSQSGSGANLTTISYDDTTGNRTVTNALGEQETYKFTTLQGVPKVTEIDRLATATTAAATRKFTYDANGYTASSTDWNGNLTTYVNDIHGQPTTMVEASGTAQARTTITTYHPTFHLPLSIVTPGLTSTFTYDGNGELLTKTLTDTTTTTAPYTTSGTARTWIYTWSNFLLDTARAPRTDVPQVTSFTYDASGALTSTTNALGQITKVTSHTGGGLPLTVVDSNGVTTTLTYDARQRLLTSTLATTAGALTTTLTYDAAGNLIKTTLPDGSAMATTYDSAHRLIQSTDLFNHAYSYTLDALGDRTQTQILDNVGNVKQTHTTTFDALGRMLHDVGGMGQKTIYSYDSNGNALTITDPLGHVTKQTFDALNRLTSATDAAGGTTQTTYDAHDRPLTVTDANGGTTSYVYDGFGDVIQRTSPDTGTTVNTYDLAGNLTQSVNAAGATTNSTYDALNRPLTTAYPTDKSENVAYTYDQTGHGFGIGRLTSVTDAAGSLSRKYDERGNVLSETRVHGTATLKTSTTYDAASRVLSLTYPSGCQRKVEMS